MANSDTFLALADFLIPAYEKKPSFGACLLVRRRQSGRSASVPICAKLSSAPCSCGHAKTARRLALEKLNAGDGEAFSALTTIVIATYYMNPKVRESIGYPGQENVSYDSKATQSYLLDGSLAKVIARGRKYRPTPGL